MAAQPPDITSDAPISPLMNDLLHPSSSSSSVTIADFAAAPPPAIVNDPVAVKEHEEDYGGDDETAADFDGLGCKTPPPYCSSSVNLPSPMEGLNEIGPPPFLKKTFEMVEDPATNDTVSWSKNGDSFIVWDAFDFSKNLLPKCFKHSNFSSFIRQLNTYGFRKIDPDKWEFANEGFRGGKKHLLKNIKRRSRHHKQQQEEGNSHGDEPEKLVLESQIETLNNDQDQLRLEILKLRHQQEESETRISAVENRIQSATNKQLQMRLFLAKAKKSRSFLGNFLGKVRQRKELDGGVSRKRRLIDGSSADECVECRNQAGQQLATLQTQLAEILGEDSEEGKAMPKLFETPMMCDVENQESAYHLMAEKLLDEGGDNRNSGDENLDGNESKFCLELEELIGTPRAWGGFATELAGCI